MSATHPGARPYIGSTSSQPFSGPLQQQQQQPSQQPRQEPSQPPLGPVSAVSSSQQTSWGRQGPNRLEPVSTSFNPAYTSVHPEPSALYSIPRDAAHHVDSHYLQSENRHLREEIQRLYDQIGRSRLVVARQCYCFQAPSIDLLMEHLTRMNDINWERVQKELKDIQRSLSLLREDFFVACRRD